MILLNYFVPMKTTSSNLLVLCDLRESSLSALQYAGFLADLTNRDVILLHLKWDGSPANAVEVLDEWRRFLSTHFQGEIRTIIEEGDILRDIKSLAEGHDCEMVLMPTHGMQGFQEVAGSLALNVMTEVELPFIAVKAGTSVAPQLKRILLAGELRNQMLEELDAFIQLAKTAEAETIVYFHERDKSALRKSFEEQIKSAFERQQLKVSFQTSLKYDFSRAVLDYALELKPDLIATLNFSYESLFTINPRTDEEDLIYNNAGIPVYLITPKNKEEDLDMPEDEMI